MKRILIIEDDRDIVELVRYNLANEGYQITAALDGSTGLAALRKSPPDLLLLDLMLPRISGLEICREIRRDETLNRLPILMLTARGDEADRVVGLEMGADDYVTKPFGVRELLARIHALLRRTAAAPSSAPDAQAPFQIGAATIDPKTFQLKRGKTVEELTAKELKLLQLFAAHRGEVFSRDRLLNEVWGYNYYGTTRTLDQVIVQLRKKLGDSGDEPQYLLTVHGVGYKLVA